MKKKIFITVGVLLIIMIVTMGVMFMKMLQQMNNTDPTFWEKDIQKIEDRYEHPKDVDIVFIGSSSIRKWETLAEDFSGYDVVNHGFGGSKVADSTYYYDRLVTPFSPEAIVFFAGTNNIHGMTDSSDTGEAVFEAVKAFFEKSVEEMPDVEVYYISISPTKARWSVWEEADKANQLIKAYAEVTDGFTMIDTTEVLLKDGAPNEDILVGDGLHLNEKGYEIWTSLIKPIVTENID